MRRSVFFILMLLWMAGIFVFSSRSGDESAEDSYFVGAMVGDLFVPGFDEWSMERQQEFAEMIDHPVRKTAHAAEYAVLGLLAAGVCIPSIASRSDENEIQEEAGYGGFINSRVGKAGKELLVPWVIAAAYAATDEFHQLFVPGRSGQISDVVLDSAGALAGLLILTVVRGIMKNRRNRVKNSTE